MERISDEVISFFRLLSLYTICSLVFGVLFFGAHSRQTANNIRATNVGCEQCISGSPIKDNPHLLGSGRSQLFHNSMSRQRLIAVSPFPVLLIMFKKSTKRSMMSRHTNYMSKPPNGTKDCSRLHYGKAE